MSAFSDENIARALERVATTASKDLQALLQRAEERKITPLVEAISQELTLRGAVDFDAKAAHKHAEWADMAAELSLADTITMAFKEVPINADELELTCKIAQTPGIGYQALVDFRGKGDVSLILGHMIYERLGFFRKFISDVERISDLLFQREVVSGRVSYRLTQAAENAFHQLKLI